jgi:enamine deaminase RidA (YjgF/YER057c/UK114 family)
MLHMKPINPWQWQDAFGFSQAVEVRGAERVLYCAGQTSVDAQGNPVHAGDMAAQLNQALDNLETVLAQSGMSLRNVARLNYYTTNVPELLKALAQAAPRLESAGCKPPGTLLGIASLFHPDLWIEVEATAVG